MKKKVAGAALLSLAAAAPAMADVGLGVGVRSNDTAIYVPIGINERFLLEPFVRQLHQKFEAASQNFSATLKVDQWLLGVGAFYVKPLADSFHLYLGGRVSYLKQEQDTRQVVFFPPFPPDVEVDEQKADGYRLAPTLGIEYAFNEHLSIAGEAEYFYSKIDGDGDATDQTANGTNTLLVLRFRF